jgi:copper(I)-binding protein
MKLLIPALLMSTSLTQAADLTIDSAMARAVPPTAKMSAAFMTLTNNANTDLAVLSAESSVAKAVELHNNTMSDGKMKMRQVNQIDLPANQTTELKPGGLHVMLIGLNKALVEGETIDLTLNFSDGSSEALEIPIQQIKPMMQKMHEHKH